MRSSICSSFLDDHAVAPQFNWRSWPADRACSIPNLFSVSRDEFENRAAGGFVAKDALVLRFTFLRHALKILVRRPPLVQDPTERSLQPNRAAPCRYVRQSLPVLLRDRSKFPPGSNSLDPTRSHALGSGCSQCPRCGRAEIRRFRQEHLGWWAVFQSWRASGSPAMP